MPRQDSQITTATQRQPLPVAQLLEQFRCAKTEDSRHELALYVWEVIFRLIGVNALTSIKNDSLSDAHAVEISRGLACPSLGHWRGIIRHAVAAVAAEGNPFEELNDQLNSKRRVSWESLSGLGAAIENAVSPSKAKQTRSSVSLPALFDGIVRYRNAERGHSGLRPPEFRARMAESLVAGALELLERVDILSGSRLIYLSEIRQIPAAGWQIQPFDLTGHSAQKLKPWVLPTESAEHLPHAESLYLFRHDGPAQGEEFHSIQVDALKPLHPLISFDGESDQVFFLNARRGKQGVELLCYTSGEHRRDVSPKARCIFLKTLLGRTVAESELTQLELEAEADETTSSPPLASVRNSEPRYLGDFELISRIGRGGMGIVYRAQQLSLGRTVAVKRLTNAGAQTSVARFKREILALGRVDHPSLVKIHTSGSDGDDHFYAMELVEGADLSEVLNVVRNSSDVTAHSKWQAAVSTACEMTRTKESPVDQPIDFGVESAPDVADNERSQVDDLGLEYVEQCIRMAQQIANALSALHKEGVVHRDVKPSNIMVTTSGDRAVLTDLGLAQLVDQDDNLTRTRHFVGTLQYASPEQVLAAYKVDCRSDIYSLGATLWECLTLSPLFGANGDIAEQELIRCIQRNRPPNPSKFNKHVTADLDSVVLRCLEKDETRRYQTADQLSGDLQAILDGRPIQRTANSRVSWRPALCIASILILVSFIAFNQSKPVPTVEPDLILKTTSVDDDVVNAPVSKDVSATKADVSVMTTGGEAMGQSARTQPNLELANYAFEILQSRCFSCHGDDRHGADFSFGDRESLITSRLLVPGSTEDSFLLEYVEVFDHLTDLGEQALANNEVNVLKEWINEGAVFPTLPERKWLSTLDTWNAIAADASKASTKDRENFRYLVLTHLHNKRDIQDMDLLMTRLAVSKLANSLSWNTKLAAPVAVDDDRTILRIDLRDYGWESRTWTEFAESSPFPVPASLSAMNFRDTAIALFGGDTSRVIRGDWFVVAASRPPWYARFLQLPDNLAALEKKLGVVSADTDDGATNIVRAGVTQSGVSSSNRLIERHESEAGSYWKSYDFGGENSRSDLSRFPLGPAYAKEGTAAFQHDGSESIFSLPNNLQGYMLTTDRGLRIDMAPTSIVSDSARLSGSHEVVNGISCIGCHRQGIISLEDSLPSFASNWPASVKEQMKPFLRTEAELHALVDNDRSRFMRSMSELVELEIDQIDVMDLPEPISAATRIFRSRLTTSDIAAEAGMTEETLIAKIESLPQLYSGRFSLKSGVDREYLSSMVNGKSVFQTLIDPISEEAPVIDRPVGLFSESSAALQEGIGRLTGLIADFFDRERRDKVILVGSVVDPDGSSNAFFRSLLIESLENRGFEIRRAKLTINFRVNHSVIEVRTRQYLALRIKAEIRERELDDLLQSIAIPIHGAEVYQYLATTCELPANQSEHNREILLDKSILTPSFFKDGSLVKTSKGSNFGIEILERNQGTSALEAYVPTNSYGQAYVQLKSEDEFVIRIRNTSEFEAAVTLTIDGLNMFAFSRVSNSSSQLLVPAKGQIDVLGWHITDSNSEAFTIGSYAKNSIASIGNPSTDIGTITVGFHAAWAPEDTPPTDEPVSKGPNTIGQGRLVEQTFAPVSRVIGKQRAVITVRYSR